MILPRNVYITTVFHKHRAHECTHTPFQQERVGEREPWDRRLECTWGMLHMSRQEPNTLFLTDYVDYIVKPHSHEHEQVLLQTELKGSQQ